MRLLFKQRFLSWFDSYDIYDEEGRTAYTVEGKLSWGHRLEIYGPAGDHLGTVKEEVLTLLPRFALYAGEEYLGCIRKEFALFHPRFTLDCNGWEVEGSFLEWDYAVTDPAGRTVMAASKELLHLCAGHRPAGGRPAVPDDRAGHRRGQVLRRKRLNRPPEELGAAKSRPVWNSSCTTQGIGVCCYAGIRRCPRAVAVPGRRAVHPAGGAGGLCRPEKE